MFAVLFANIKPETKARVAYMRPLHELLCVAAKNGKRLNYILCYYGWRKEQAERE